MDTRTFKNFCLYSAVFLIWAASAPVLNAYSSGGGNGDGGNNGGNNLERGPFRVIDVCVPPEEAVDGDGGCCKVCVAHQPGICGNGVVEGGEECEPGVGRMEPGFICDPQCKKAPRNPNCGDGIQGPAEVCDDGDNDDTNACTNACRPAACGDNIKTATEPCDDGNTVSGDGCSATCETEYLCGNNTINDGEACDDGNTSNDDGCSSSCQTEYVCGNGDEEPGETCDDGNTLDGDGCDSVCQEENLCGTNNIVDEGEECEPTVAGNEWCTNECTSNVDPPTCSADGNGTIIKVECTWPDQTTVIASRGPITASSPSLDISVAEYKQSEAGTSAMIDVQWSARPGFADNELPASNQTVSVSYALPGCNPSQYQNWDESTDEQANIGLTCGPNDYAYHHCGAANDQWVVSNLNGDCRCETGDQVTTACNPEE